MSNYNMVETIEMSVTSVVEQLDDRFEVVVIDDGSTDGSVEILERLEAEYDRLRVCYDADNDNLAEARNHSFEEARGNYVLASLDTDDQYTQCIREFVDLYHQFEVGFDGDFFLLGVGLYIAPRNLLLDVPYRSLGYGEDRDFFRRLIANGSLLSLEHRNVEYSLGYDRSLRERFEVGFETMAVQFQSGLHFWPYVRWACEEIREEGGQELEWYRGLAHLVLAPFAYLRSLRGPHYEAPPEFTDIGRYKEAVRRTHMTAEEMADYLGVELDWEAVGPRGRAIFDVDEAGIIID
ncbi:glycosyltransferase family 2 protein [Halarchaeum grantii]|nr:glycosyltransferase family 2 protein [Halarchaeum grantii]